MPRPNANLFAKDVTSEHAVVAAANGVKRMHNRVSVETR
jgi:hypothetical protein